MYTHQTKPLCTESAEVALRDKKFNARDGILNGFSPKQMSTDFNLMEQTHNWEWLW